MLNLDNIDIARRYTSDHEEVESIRSYIYQLYQELEFRLGELEKNVGVIEHFDEKNVGLLHAADYVEEQGTSGIWMYRKWGSGIAECWTTSDIVLAIESGSAVSPTTEVTFPITFAARPTFTTGLCQNATSALNAGIVDQVSISTTKLELKSFRNSANGDGWNVEPRVYVYVRGRWK